MDQSVILSACGLNLYYGENHALKDISIDIKANKITALIGPSGCGKSTFLRTIDRMNDLIPSVKITGSPHLPRAGDLRPRRGRHRPAPAHRHGVPEAQPLSHVYLRQRGLRPPHPWSALQAGLGRAGGEVPASGRHLGRGERPAEKSPPWACLAASSSACASPGPWPSNRRCC